MHRSPVKLIILTIVAAGFAATMQQARAQAFSITNFNLVLNGPRTAQFSADAASYYILYSGTIVTNVSQPIAMALGTSGSLSLQDASPQTAAQFYRVARIPLTQPLDSDGDGIDDVFELSYPGCLNPLDATDASVDCDGDGRSNLQEFYDGTNPVV